MERLTITLTTELADRVKAAIAEGNYGSVSEVMRQALRDWELAEARRQAELKSLRDEVDAGLAQVKAGKVRPFSVDRIVKAGQRIAAKKR